jgi:hypothetical protein
MSGASHAVRVELPLHLRRLAAVAGHEVTISVSAAPTVRSLLDALEQQYPTLRGTVRDYATGERRAFLRFFACEEDLSLLPQEMPLPDAVVDGREPFMILGAIAGG